jgi:hypothetical protein
MQSIHAPYEKLFKNLNYLTDHFNIDLDDHNKGTVKNIVEQINICVNPKGIVVYQNKLKYKHFHLEIILNQELSIGCTIFLRLIFQDHQERIKHDLDRLIHDELESFAYIGDKKYEVDLTNGQKKKVGEYKRIEL